MLKRMRSTWLAGGGAVLLILSMTGLAAAAPLLDDTVPATLATFEDLNGNGIDDDCETAVTADEAAVTAAMAVVDANADGVISVTEAAHSDWVGGKNCNHGGYVSTVAHGSEDCDEADAPEAATDEAEDGSPEDSDHAAIETAPGTPIVEADCAEDASEAEADEEAPAVCEVAPPVEGAPVAVPMSHVEVAHSDMIGGKNCNHGGAVSESAKAAKAERQAERLAAKEARQAAREAKTHGKSNKHAKHGGPN